MVSYHRPNDLKRSVTSFLAHTPEPFTLYLWDNSCGAIDHVLDQFQRDPRIVVYRNDRNLGKSGSFARHYRKIPMIADHFVSADGDVVVSSGWYEGLRGCAPADYAAIAPVIVDGNSDVQRMHRRDADTVEISPGVFRNWRTAGTLLLVSRSFYESWGGYSTGRIYGGDDSALCKEAHRRHRFVGYTNHVSVIHSNLDADAGYARWKAKNVQQQVDQTGYWD